MHLLSTWNGTDMLLTQHSTYPSLSQIDHFSVTEQIPKASFYDDKEASAANYIPLTVSFWGSHSSSWFKKPKAAVTGSSSDKMENNSNSLSLDKSHMKHSMD